jgi:UDP-N-acetylmuramoylalanine--D-glutamate ligase
VSAARPRPELPGGPYLVVGLARSGQAAARLLAARGEEVVGVDSGEPEGAAGLAEAGVEVLLGEDGVRSLRAVRTVVKSPGVPADAPVVAGARERAMTVIGELELAWRLLPNRFVAVTGTNGKTTVVEWLGHVWRCAGESVAVAGNVGTPLASLVGTGDATIVCECSSFQLEDSEAFAPECAVLLNVAADHLDRHPTMGEYLEAKLRIFGNQQNEDVAVFNGNEQALKGVDLGGCGRRVAFCHEDGDDCEVVMEGEAIVAAGEPLIELSELRVLGRHQAENGMAVAAAALSMDIERDAIVDGLRTFLGVPHRLERVREIDGVLFVNDSKATNVAAARAAIATFDGGVHAILGGSSKGEGFEGLAEVVGERCSACYLIGATAEELEQALKEAGEAGALIHRHRDLESAVTAAASAAHAGEVVLLSPACASFDAYRDFEERGDHFRSLVTSL